MRSPFSSKDGRGERIRTSDPLVPNQVLYQAEPLPDAVRWIVGGKGLRGLYHLSSQLG